jgi:hypothetical protein
LLNSVEGQGDTQKEQLKHVISLHEIYNRDSLPQLAKMFHLNENTVLNAWNEHLGIQRLSRLGFDFEGKQPQNTIIALGRIPTDLVLMKAAEFVAHYDVTGRDTEDLVKQLKGVRAKGESAEIEVIQKHHDKAEETRRKNKSRTRKTGATACTRFFGTVRSINRKVQGGIEHLYLTALPDVDDAITVAEDNIEHMTKIKEELYRIKRLHAASHGGSGMPIAAAPHI